LTTAEAELALEESAVLEENATTASETLLSSEANDLAELIAAAVESVVIGTTTPLESMVPVIVVATGPFGLSEVTTVVTIGGRGNWDDGNGLPEVEVLVWGGSTFEL
jgi:hypothetical protein